jgi:hypothetical protein
MELQNNLINIESINDSSTLDIVKSRLKPGETLILDIGNNYYNQADKLFEELAGSGYYVRKTLVNGRNQLLVAYMDNKHQMY